MGGQGTPPARTHARTHACRAADLATGIRCTNSGGPGHVYPLCLRSCLGSSDACAAAVCLLCPLASMRDTLNCQHTLKACLHRCTLLLCVSSPTPPPPPNPVCRRPHALHLPTLCTQMCYGVVIVTFLGAVHWGVAMAMPLTSPVAYRLANEAFVWSVIPSVMAWPVALMDPCEKINPAGHSHMLCVEEAHQQHAGGGAVMEGRAAGTQLCSVCLAGLLPAGERAASTFVSSMLGAAD